MKISLLVSAALLAVAWTDAFTGPSPRSKTAISRGSFLVRTIFNKKTHLFAGETISQSDESADKPTTLSKETTATTPKLAEVNGVPSAPELPEKNSASSPPQSAITQTVGREVLSTLTATPGIPAGASFGAVALGGLAVARGVLGQRQKKLDEEKRNLEEQQQRLEKETAKLQKDTSQNNLLLSTIGSVAVGTVLTTGGLVEELTESTVQSLNSIGASTSMEAGIKESLKGGGFKTTAGTIGKTPALNELELPYLENKIEQMATKKQTTKILRNRREKLSLQQNELESMAIKREEAIAKEEARLKAIADEEERLRAEEEALQRKMLAERNEAARLKAAEEAEAARLKAAEEAEAARLKAAEEAEAARLKAAEEAEAVRLKEAEQARIEEEANEARMKKEAEEARIQEEKLKEEQLRRLEEESLERERQEAISREQRALEILRQQEEEMSQQQQLSIASSATAAGVKIWHEYASKFNDAFILNQESPSIDVEQLQSLLKQLGISQGIAGGIAATLVLGGGVTAIKMVIDEAQENIDASEDRAQPEYKDNKFSNKDDWSLRNAELEKSRVESTKQPTAVRKTLRISADGNEVQSDSQQTQMSLLSNGKKSDAKSLSSLKVDESAVQPKVTAPSAKADTNTFDQQTSISDPVEPVTPPAIKNRASTSSKTTSNPFENKIPPSSFSGSTNFGMPSSSQSKTSTGFKNLSPSSKNTSMTNVENLPNTFESSQKELGGSYIEEGSSQGALSKQSGPRKQATAPSSTFAPKIRSTTDFGSPPPKSTKLPLKRTSAKFGTPPKQRAPKVEPISKFVNSTQKSSDKGNNSSFGAPEISAFGTQTASSFGAATPKTGPSDAFELSGPKANGSSNSFGSPPKSLEGLAAKQANSPFAAARKQTTPGKKLASPFDTSTPKSGPSSAFGSPLATTDSPFGMSPKIDAPFQQRGSQPENFSSKRPGSQFSFGSSGKQQVDSRNEKKIPFSPFSQSNVSLKKSKPSFSSSGPVYMPPTTKANNAASLNDIYSSLDGKQSKNISEIQERQMRKFKETEIPKATIPKKSFSPFGGTKPLSKSTFRERSSAIPSTSSTPLDTSVNINDSNSSFRNSLRSPRADQRIKKSFSPYGTKPLVSVPNTIPKTASFGAPPVSTAKNSQDQRIKKSFSPYGRKPAQKAENLPKIDPSSFSFGAPPPTPSSQENLVTSKTSTSSFSFGPGGASSISTDSSPSTKDPFPPNGPGNLRNSRASSAPKPFAATGFPPMGKMIDRDQEDKRLKDPGMNAAILDEQSN